MKETNPKDGIGIKKWRQFATLPMTVMCEVGVAMLEGAAKYGRHNYRVSGVKASVYVDAAVGHIMQWWEGEDIDDDSKLSHITKAISSLVVLRDAMIQQQLNDDRPPKAKLDDVRNELQRVVDAMFEKYPEGAQPYTEHGKNHPRTTYLTGAKLFIDGEPVGDEEESDESKVLSTMEYAMAT
ncbi:dATP/dGTP diphosphohydrolase domain-containing protein [Agrobacterium tumefaciens]|uniref:dATP/dGTP diphosphohydrolase domain-containing protein n=1 Tax=Agrobacterium tumefaciens TaxID=358 RepID=UPI001573BF6A